jgi:uncharacterized membrane protein
MDKRTIHQSHTTGERIADAVCATMGSWRFIILQSVLIACWISLNIASWAYHWDPAPFILLNLLFSVQAAYASPLILMSQNRQAAKDRLEAEHDYAINSRAEAEVARLLEQLTMHHALLLELSQKVDAVLSRTRSSLL